MIIKTEYRITVTKQVAEKMPDRLTRYEPVEQMFFIGPAYETMDDAKHEVESILAKGSVMGHKLSVTATTQMQ